jgi:transposase InsO family protein
MIKCQIHRGLGASGVKPEGQGAGETRLHPLCVRCSSQFVPEVPFAFALAVQALGIRHRYIRPRRPQQNGKVERSHRIDHEEFWGRHRFADFDAAAVGLRAWEARYNHERFSLALQGRTPAEKLATLQPAPAA